MGTLTTRFTFFLLPLAFFVSGCASTPSDSKKNLSKQEKARLLVEIANGALVEGDPTGALQSLARAEEFDRGLPELYHSKALAYYGKHNLADAVSCAEKAVKIKPNYADANNTLGKLYMDLGRYPDAEAPLQRAASDALYREAYKAWTNLGILEYRRNQYVKAEEYLNHAIQDAPQQSCIAYYYRGHIRLREMRNDEAVKDYSHATKKLCARFGEAYYALGIAYQQSRQFDLARKTFLDVEKRYPNTQFAEKAMDQLRFLP